MIQVHAREIIKHGEKDFNVVCCKLVDFCQLTNKSTRAELEELLTGCMTIPILVVDNY
jgi:hypothetical protein